MSSPSRRGIVNATRPSQNHCVPRPRFQASHNVGMSPLIEVPITQPSHDVGMSSSSSHLVSRKCINPIASQPDSQLEKSWKTLRPRCQELGDVDRRIAVHAQSGCNELRHVQRPLQRNGIHSAVYASARPVSFEVQCHELLP